MNSSAIFCQFGAVQTPFAPYTICTGGLHYQVMCIKHEVMFAIIWLPLQSEGFFNPVWRLENVYNREEN